MAIRILEVLPDGMGSHERRLRQAALAIIEDSLGQKPFELERSQMECRFLAEALQELGGAGAVSAARQKAAGALRGLGQR